MSEPLSNQIFEELFQEGIKDIVNKTTTTKANNTTTSPPRNATSLITEVIYPKVLDLLKREFLTTHDPTIHSNELNPVSPSLDLHHPRWGYVLLGICLGVTILVFGCAIIILKRKQARNQYA